MGCAYLATWMAQDVGKVLWCHSSGVGSISWLVRRGHGRTTTCELYAKLLLSQNFCNWPLMRFISFAFNIGPAAAVPAGPAPTPLHSHLVWLVFKGSIPTCGCFHSENFCDLFLLFFLLLFFVLLFRNSKREEVGGEAKGKMHGLWSMIMFTYIQLRITIKLPNTIL